MTASLSAALTAVLVVVAVAAAAARTHPAAVRMPPRAPGSVAVPHPPQPRRPSSSQLRVVGVLIMAVITMAGAPLVAALLAGTAWIVGRRRSVRTRRERERAVARSLPDVVDLLLLCTSAGLSLPVAHPLLAQRAPRPLDAALRTAATEAGAGRPRADALLDAMAPFGDRAERFAHVLVDHLRYGMPLTPGLERLGAELRIDRRRRAEEDARRVPVRLLLPLVSCVLPAFALLTVVPLLAASLRSLPT